MRILGQTLSPMYVWTIALISALVIVSGYTLRAFPLSLIVATIVCAIVDALVRKYYLKHAFKVPYSGLITGLIIGSVVPINAPVLLVLIASIAAVASKFFRYKGTNIFNPAAFGIIFALSLFEIGDQWWVASNYNIYGLALSLSPILIIAAYQARRLPAVLCFVAVSFLLTLVTSLNQLSVVGALSVLLGINFFFAFVMVADPKTSPHNVHAQFAYGALIALLYIGFAYLRLPYSLILALLIGNLLHLLYKKYK